jgi:large subunit ribosomal protein L10
MENPRPEKVAVVDEVREKLSSAEAVVLTEYRGLTVKALAELRTNLREVGGEYRVYKNTLVRRAAAELELGLEDQLTGPTALAFVGNRPDGTPPYKKQMPNDARPMTFQSSAADLWFSSGQV